MVLRDFDQGMVCFDAFDGASVERTLAQHPEIELLLLDRRLPDCDGMDLLVRLVEAHPALPIVMLSAEFDADTVTQAIDRGAAGFIPKTSVTNVLVSALKLIMAGGIYVPPEVLSCAIVVQFWDTPDRAMVAWSVAGAWIAIWLVATVFVVSLARKAGNGFAMTRKELANDWTEIKEQL